MTRHLIEAGIERMAFDELKALGWERVCGLKIAGDGLTPERSSYGQVVLVGRLRAALERINPHLPLEAIDQAIGRLLRPENPSLIENNRAFHYMLTDGGIWHGWGRKGNATRQRGFEPLQQEQMVLQYVGKHGRITRREVAELCQLGPFQATRLLNRLVKAERLIRRGTKKGAYYIMSGSDKI